MRDLRGKRYWLIGASEGLGASLARHMAKDGAQLVLSARSPEKLRDLADTLGAQALPMDVSDAVSVSRAAETVGEIDGVVYLAGAYWPMRAQAWQVDQSVAMAEVNFTGALRVLGHVVPPMAARGHGHVVLTGSLSGFVGLPGAIGYAASKAAVMSLAETLDLDLRNTGVDVQLVNPGFIRTRLTDKNTFAMRQIMEPADAAQRMLNHMKTRRFALSYPAPFAWVFRLARFLPHGLYLRLFG